MSIDKSRLAFGSEADIDAALENGLIDPHDLLFLDEGKIAWIDEAGNKVITGEKDWCENDSAHPEFIKNRICFTEGGFQLGNLICKGEFGSESVAEADNGNKWIQLNYPVAADALKNNMYYRLCIDDRQVDYQCKTITRDNGENMLYLGDSNLANALLSGSANLDPQMDASFFALLYSENLDNAQWYISVGANGNLLSNAQIHTISIHELTGTPEIVHKIDPKYYERLAWEEVVDATILESTEMTLEEGVAMFVPSKIHLIDGETYTITINDNSYESVAFEINVDDLTAVCIGNRALTGLEGEATDEPFFIAADAPLDGVSADILIICNPENISEPYPGNPIISIVGMETIVKKIDEKYLPDGIAFHPNYAQNNPLANDYIQNRPCYKSVLTVNITDVSNAGAPTFNRGFFPFVKVAEYIPYGEWAYDIKLNSSSNIDILGVADCEFDYNNLRWELHDIDVTYVLAYSDEYVSNNELNTIGVPESGIYVINGKPFGVDIVATIPLIKQLDKSMLSVEWDDLNNIPFGTVTGRTIYLTEPVERENYNFIKYTLDENGEADEAVAGFHRVWPKAPAYEDLLGCQLIMSDGSVITVTEEKLFFAKNEYNGFYFIGVNNILLSFGSYDEATLSKVIFTDKKHVYQHQSDFYPLYGLYTSNATGAYVTEIKFPDEVKQLPSELIPIADDESTGGIKAEAATPDDVLPVRINEEGKLFTTPIAYDGEATITLIPGVAEQAPFTELVGLKVVDKIKGRRMLTTPKERPVSSGADYECYFECTEDSNDSAVRIIYSNANVLDKRCFFIYGDAMGLALFSIFFDGKYDALMYAYESTSDTVGSGVTFEKGWYAVNSKTFEYEVVDIVEHPVFTSTELLLSYTISNIDYLYECFPLAEELSYTVKEENILTCNDTKVVFNANYENVANVAVVAFLQPAFGGFVYRTGNNSIMYDDFVLMPGGVKESCAITYPMLKQIDQKFIPAALITDEEVDTLMESIE